MTGEIFTVAGLLADEHQSRACAAFAKDGLRCILIEVASMAVSSRFAQTA